MIIDFKEIPPANSSDGQQDTFELFARDFFEDLGYKIERPPDRGPDGKKDMIINEVRKGIMGETKFWWLVSCKHKAHSGKAVNVSDEPDIVDRLINHKCQGFIGFYSTLPSSPLTNKLFGCGNKFEYLIFDYKKIEKKLLEPKHLNLFSRYFSYSYIKYKKLLGETKTSIATNSSSKKIYYTNLSEDELIRLSQIAIILTEIEKIKEEFFSYQKEWNEEVLIKLYKYSKYSHKKITYAVLDFLSEIAELTRGGMPSRIAHSIYSLILTFYPTFNEKNISDQMTEEGKMCINIGFSLTYDALIHADKFLIAEYGLSIFKFIYRFSNENKLDELKKEVIKKHEEIADTLMRPERKDLENAKELVRIFKEDLDEWDLSFPILPKHLQKLADKNKD